MEEMVILEGELKEIQERIGERKLEDIGTIELRRIKFDLIALHGLIIDLQEKAKTNASSMDIYELQELINRTVSLNDKESELLFSLDRINKAKVAYGMSKIHEQTTLERAREEALRYASEKQKEIDNYNTQLNAPYLDEGIKTTLETVIASAQSDKERWENLANSYEEMINNLEHEITVIRFGGNIPEFTEENEENKPLSEDDEKELRTRLVKDLNEIKEAKEQEELNTNIEIPSIANTTLDTSVDTEDDEKSYDFVNPMIGVPSLDIPTTEDNTEEEDNLDEVDEETESFDKIDEADEAEISGDADEEDEELEALPAELEDEDLEELPDELEDEDLEELPEELDEEEESNENEETDGVSLDTPVGFVDKTYLEDPGKDPNISLRDMVEKEKLKADIIEPNPSIWKKIGKGLLAAAGAFLAIIAAGKIINGINDRKNAEEEETEETEHDVTPSPSPTAEPTATPKPSHGGDGPTPTVAPTATPTPSPTATPTPTPTIAPVNSPIAQLSPTEPYIVNTETGVEVSHTGEAYQHTSSGTTVLPDRDLPRSNGTSSVSAQDLQPNPVAPAPRTGSEVSEEQARQGMTSQEEANLDDAMANAPWTDFFEQQYGRG